MNILVRKLPARTDAVPKVAMIMAAGHGDRMAPLTQRIPKPLLRISGATLLDRALDRVFLAGVEKVVINISHLADKIEAFVAERGDPRILVSHEDEALETGGGLVKALPLLGDQPFYVINGDSLWIDGAKCPLLRLAERWDGARMDALLLVTSLARAEGFGGFGDFTMEADGRLRRRTEGRLAPFAYMGVSIVNPGAFVGAPKGAFSLNRTYDEAIARDRLFGLTHDGLWYHISTPEDLEVARRGVASGHQPAIPPF